MNLLDCEKFDARYEMSKSRPPRGEARKAPRGRRHHQEGNRQTGPFLRAREQRDPVVHCTPEKHKTLTIVQIPRVNE